MSEDNLPTAPQSGEAEDLGDDFLFHFYHAGEMFRSGRLVEAKEQLEKAASIQPDNPKCQNLLGLVHFKLGLYQRSIEIYRALVDRFPGDPTLRVNLATVFYKSGQISEAEKELLKAVELKDDHEKAHRTLAVVLMKRGEKEKAKEHLRKAGIEANDRLMKNVWGVDGMLHQETVEPDLTDMETTIDQNIQQTTQPVGPSEQPQDVPAIESDEPAVPRQLAALRATVSHMTFQLEDKNLRAYSADRLYTRMNTVSWLDGNLSFSPVKKRFEGEETKYPFGTESQTMLLVEGQGTLAFAPDEGAYFLYNLRDDSGFFLEEHVFAFSDSEYWENGQLPTEGEAGIPVFHLKGPAQIVLVCPGRVQVRVLDGQGKLMIHMRKLIGWSGTLVPRLFRATEPLPEGLWIEITGKGEVLLQT